MSEPTILTAEDKLTSTWKKIMDHCERRITALRIENDRDIDDKKTVAIRAEIKVLKSIQALDKAPPDLD